jgi:Uma2 family endonuclease
MSVALSPPWTAENFLDWAATQEKRYEFDGVRPVAMTGGNATHNRITINIHVALRARLRGTLCSHYGPDLGVKTMGSRIRYPDALITCTQFPGADRIAQNPVAVFEVLSPTSGSIDRILKLREYQSIPSILYYIIVESAEAGLQLLHRAHGGDPWKVQALTAEDVLALPEIGIDLPVAEFYEDVVFEEVAAPS